MILHKYCQHRFLVYSNILHGYDTCNFKYFKKDHFIRIKKKIHIIKKRFPYYIIGIYVLIVRIFRNFKKEF